MTETKITLADGQRQLALTDTELWIRCLALGGSSDIGHLTDHVQAVDCPDTDEHKVIAQSLNDAFVERGHDHPVAYHHLHRARDGPKLHADPPTQLSSERLSAGRTPCPIRVPSTRRRAIYLPMPPACHRSAIASAHLAACAGDQGVPAYQRETSAGHVTRQLIGVGQGDPCQQQPLGDHKRAFKHTSMPPTYRAQPRIKPAIPRVLR